MTVKRKFRHWSKLPWMALVLASACTTPGSTSESRGPSPAASSTPATKPAVEIGFAVQVEPAQAPDGGVVMLTVELPTDIKDPPEGEFEDTKFPFFPVDGRPGLWKALVGIVHSHAPGPAEAWVHAGGKSGRGVIQVVDGQYNSEVLKVPDRKINPRPSDMKRIKKENVEIHAAYDTITREKMWGEGYKYPLDSAITSAFGTKRVYNGQLKSFHAGTDFRAAVGTPIHAAAGGIVRLSKNLFFTGNTVILDHGYGIMTLYAHLSKLEVKVGQRVTQGELLGLSGKTGRVNGPHLHWMSIVHRVKVSPLETMKVLH